MSFSKHLAEMQEATGKTNYALAKELGVHQSTIKYWKDGKNFPSAKHLIALATIFGKSLDELLKEDD